MSHEAVERHHGGLLFSVFSKMSDSLLRNDVPVVVHNDVPVCSYILSFG